VKLWFACVDVMLGKCRLGSSDIGGSDAPVPGNRWVKAQSGAETSMTPASIAGTNTISDAATAIKHVRLRMAELLEQVVRERHPAFRDERQDWTLPYFTPPANYKSLRPPKGRFSWVVSAQL
jgi:hypothetical protein